MHDNNRRERAAARAGVEVDALQLRRIGRSRDLLLRRGGQHGSARAHPGSAAPPTAVVETTASSGRCPATAIPRPWERRKYEEVAWRPRATGMNTYC